MRGGRRICVVIPALDEELAIAEVIAGVPTWIDEIVVADNGSRDATARIAASAGARVVCEPRRGYGRACLAGLAALTSPDVIVFMDADRSDRPEQMDRLVDPILAGKADLVIGSRVLGCAEDGALTPQQRFGNALACLLMRLIWRSSYTDLGPFRAVRATALTRLSMDDPTYGWTVQMQARASAAGLRGVEVPVDYRRRVGRSKISGTVSGVIRAGTKILWTIAAEAWTSRARRVADGAGAAP